MVEVYLRNWEECTLRITDRKGTSLLGGDIEISYVARDVGFGTGVFPELRLAHLIPKERGIAGYLLKLYQAVIRRTTCICTKGGKYSISSVWTTRFRFHTQ